MEVSSRVEEGGMEVSSPSRVEERERWRSPLVWRRERDGEEECGRRDDLLGLGVMEDPRCGFRLGFIVRVSFVRSLSGGGRGCT